MVLFTILEICKFIALTIISAIVVFIVGTYVFRFIRKYWKTIVTVVVCGLLVALVLGTLHGAARADEAIVSIKGTEPVIADNKLQLRVYFNYNGQLLSWYEIVKKDTCFDTTCLYHVVIENSIEVVDAEEVKICPFTTSHQTSTRK